MLVRYLLITPLIVLVIWMSMAFFVVREHNVAHKKDQLVLGTIGEPDALNPIISQSTSASTVESFVFNALVKYDENLNIVGDLAEDYRITQNSTAFLADEKQAAEVLAKLNNAHRQWPKMQLASCRQENNKLILHFSDPKKRIVAGTSYEEELFKIIDRRNFLPTSIMTIQHNPSLELLNGKKATTDAIKERIIATANKLSSIKIYEIIPITDSMISLSVTGGADTFREELKSALKAQKGQDKEQAGDIFDYLDQPLLNEPVITFKIRKGIRWHDGKPLTAADAVFTYKSILNPKYRSPRSSSYWPVKYVEMPDPYTFIVVYRMPYGEGLSSWMMNLIPKHILDGKSSQWWADNFNPKPVGTGPYKVVEWKSNEFVRLEKNPHYFEGPPNLSGVVYRIVPDPFVNQVAFDARGFDTNTLLPFQVPRYLSDKKTFRVFQRWGLGYLHIGWNLQKPMFQDRRVRIALAHAVDIDRIIKYVYRGYGRKSKGTFPEQMWYANKDIKPYPYDPQKARQLLAEAGWKDTDKDGWLVKDGKRFEFTLITNHGNTNRAAIQVLVQDDLKKIGIKVQIATYEWAVFLKNYINTKDFDACILAWYLGHGYDLFQLWHSSQIETPGLNHCSYSNREVDELLVKIRTTFDRDEIKRLCSKVQEIIYRDQPYLFLLTAYASNALYRDKYVVRRPDGKGGWIIEPIRDTELSYTIYSNWWAPKAIAPHPTP